jgi:hypothetical protein
LYVRDEETSLHKADGAAPVSDGILSTPATDFQALPEYLWGGTSTDKKSHEKIGDGGTTSMLLSRKRSAEALNQDIEEKGEAYSLGTARVSCCICDTSAKYISQHDASIARVRCDDSLVRPSSNSACEDRTARHDDGTAKP